MFNTEVIFVCAAAAVAAPPAAKVTSPLILPNIASSKFEVVID